MPARLKHVIHHANGRIEVERLDIPGHEIRVARYTSKGTFVEGESYSLSNARAVAGAIRDLTREPTSPRTTQYATRSDEPPLGAGGPEPLLPTSPAEREAERDFFRGKL